MSDQSYNCEVCHDTGKTIGSDFLDCQHCEAPRQRSDLNHAATTFKSAYTGDNAHLEGDLRWFVHQRAAAASAARIAELERQLAEAKAAVPVWQPIETAPKDGSRFLATCAGKVGFYHWQDFKDDRSPVGWRDSFITVYREGTGPMCWMPIPAAPIAAVAEQTGHADQN